MKTLVSILAFFTVVGISAQEPQDDEQRSPRHEKRFMKDRHHPYKDMTVEQVADLKAKKLTLFLDLNDAQESKVEALLIDETARMRSEREAMKEVRDKGEKLSADERYSKMAEGLDEKIEFKRNMKDILNDQQYAKWLELEEKKHKMKKRFRAKRHAKR